MHARALAHTQRIHTIGGLSTQVHGCEMQTHERGDPGMLEHTIARKTHNGEQHNTQDSETRSAQRHDDGQRNAHDVEIH
eukprot:15452523-Alexandrium_andersonii.AAC.1